MLYADITTAAIVAGYKIGFSDWSVSQEEIEELERAVETLNEERSQDLELFVPGDTDTAGLEDASGTYVLGTPAVVTSSLDHAPTAFERSSVLSTLEDLPEVPLQYWMGLNAMVDKFDGRKEDDPGLFLLSWGPLCYAGIGVGVPMHKNDRDDAVYSFTANQNMNQNWTDNGFDGVNITGAEFTDIKTLDFSDEAHEEHMEKAKNLDDPTYYLVCRYD